jgi:hypothetical protein
MLVSKEIQNASKHMSENPQAPGFIVWNISEKTLAG